MRAVDEADPVAEDAMAKKRRRLVQRDRIDLVGRQRGARVGQKVQPKGDALVGVQPRGVEDRDVDIGKRSRRAACPGAEEIGSDHLRAIERRRQSPHRVGTQLGYPRSLVDDGHRGPPDRGDRGLPPGGEWVSSMSTIA
jgi:hypothetical protein